MGSPYKWSNFFHGFSLELFSPYFLGRGLKKRQWYNWVLEGPPGRWNFQGWSREWTNFEEKDAFQKRLLGQGYLLLGFVKADAGIGSHEISWPAPIWSHWSRDFLDLGMAIWQIQHFLKDPFGKALRKGFPLNQSYDLGMGCFDHQSYSPTGKSGGVWILRAWPAKSLQMTQENPRRYHEWKLTFVRWSMNRSLAHGFRSSLSLANSGILGGGFKYLLFSPLLREMIQFDSYYSI